MSDERRNRARFLIGRYPTLFSSEREKMLPLWAQAKLADLRLLLVAEAGNYESAVSEIDGLLEELEGRRRQ
ncbi:hypothetical protein [Streptomyces sp. NPDC048057]|uniref:hypothetical protein n=1 Tax=Streptomyces sp. NPDC048057 TaxID=3155628 RepID=UPI0033FBB840